MSEAYASAYQPDRSPKGKLRRVLVRLAHRKPLAQGPDRPMVSFTFDDAPATAAAAGAAALEARGLRGTFYVSAGLAGDEGPMGPFAEAADYRRLAAAGHEIACHTFSHLDCGQAPPETALAEAERNGAVLAEWGLPQPQHFAYPYGDVSAGPKQALQARYRTLRALHPGLIRKGADLAQAPAVGIEGSRGEARARRWLARAKARRGWLILYTHDVREAPSPWGCTPGALARLADAALADGVEVVTLSEGAARLGL